MGRIQTGAFDNLIRRLYSIKGGGSELSETLGDVFPILDLENLPSELLLLRGWVLGMGRIRNASAVGMVNSHQLFNPAGSAKIIVLTSLRVSVGSTSLVEFGPAFTALTDTSTPGTRRDTRAQVIKPTNGLLQEEDDGTRSAFGAVQLITDISADILDPNGLAVLVPGTAFRINDLTTNITMRTSWMWRERTAEPSELSF